MYFTGRAGSILRYDTRSGGGGRVEGSMERAGAHERANEALAWRSARSAAPGGEKNGRQRLENCHFEISLRFI